MYPDRSPKNLKRQVATRSVKKTVLVFCEGELTEPDYVQALRRVPEIANSASVDIRISDAHGTPVTLVDDAIRAKNADPEIDECWCLFDVEWPRDHPEQHHPHLLEAIDRAKSIPGIYTAVSNPCFEIWLLMHYTDVTAFAYNEDAARLSKAKDGRRGKAIDAAAYMPLRAEASRRAKVMEAWHSSAGTKPPQDNPSSGMHRFLDAITPAVSS